MQELIDIYDANKQPTGEVVERSKAFMKEGQFMLYVLAILENQDGKFLITRRSLDKKWAAGWWEVTGGGASAGDSSARALVREVREEVGLEVPEEGLEPVYSYQNIDLERGDNYFVDIYHCHLNFTLDDVTLQDSEAIDCQLATREEIAELNEQGIFLHYKRLQQALEAESAS